MSAAIPISNTKFAVKDLDMPAEILIDRWGIAHIRAKTFRDVFFVQGLNAARDRLWQLDLWRKRGLGLLAQDFGPGYLAQDYASRLFLYRGDMDEEWRAYGTPETRAIVEAFVAGINAFIELTADHPNLLSPEFSSMGIKPTRWDASDVVRIRSHARVRNLISEVLRAQVVSRAGLETDHLRKSLEPEWKLQVPVGLDPAEIPLEVLRIPRLASAVVNFTPERLAATLERVDHWMNVSDLGEVSALGGEGSNNWAVSSGRTSTGRPILASDPHRQHSLPSLRYVVHLTGPGIDVIGAGEPAIPGISIGHNGEAAFGLTIFPVDQEDLYVYETDRDDPDIYRYNGGWERMITVIEQFDVKGAPVQRRALRFTRHGPIVYDDRQRCRAFAVRSVWFEPGTAAYLGSLAYLGARNPAQFAEALKSWGTPSVNQVYADISGNIAWMTAGKAPQRPNWDGLFAVPGDGRYEWSGFVAPRDLPSEINPGRGYVLSANEMNLPADYAYAEHKLGFEWDERSRATRIHETLSSNSSHSTSDSMALQCDVLSIPARRVVPFVKALSPKPEIADAVALFRDWDFRISRESAAAALFEIWWSKHLKRTLLELLVPDPSAREFAAPGDDAAVLEILEAPDARLGKQAIESRDRVLVCSLVGALNECRALLGGDVTGWRWGKLHHGYFEHPLTPLSQISDLRDLDIGPHPKSGSASTPMYAAYRQPDFRVVTGASFRMVVDVGNWDASWFINSPGQSGDPRSTHYRDLAPLWANGEYVPLAYSREAVDVATRARIELEPKPDSA